MSIEKLFREKALAAEQRASEISDRDVKQEGEEIAIEWHTLASFAWRVPSDPDHLE
ncbi:hypothetical protein [Bradyrhizobium jicamae]|uniref:hypothetical protein n=1 Tax=Bradyrhizobium jicamae TaxID=280332 RepID=UPI000A85893F|nr:hypothetical protein [Bradyrhizobium jicamae]